VAALLALCGGLMWGVGDFFGGLASRRLSVIPVVVISQAIGLTGLLLWVLVAGDPFPGMLQLLPAAAAGIAVLVGLAAFYRGLAIGAMGIVAPISAVGPIVPLAVDAAHGTTPIALQWTGIALIVLGIATLSWEPAGIGRGRIAAGTGLALIAAATFGLFFVGIDAGADESGAWAVIAARGAAVSVGALAAAVTSTSLRAPQTLLPMLALVGLVDTAANVLVATATTYGSVGIVAVLSALYPLSTIVLARVVLGERLPGRRRAGAALAIVGAALVAAS